MKIITVIPAHLASVRFPRKILQPIMGLPMIEHVRRRALLCSDIKDVYIATCDDEIASTVQEFGGKVIKTKNTHTNGTSRVAEAVENIDCSHVILLQGDEPLLIPDHVSKMVNSITENPGEDMWNAVSNLDDETTLDQHSFVKCSTNHLNHVLYCFRRSPAFADFNIQRQYIKKILGIMAFSKKHLLEIAAAKETGIEKTEFIEQMRTIEHGKKIKAVPVHPCLPSLNEPAELDIINHQLLNDPEQKNIFNKINPENIFNEI